MPGIWETETVNVADLKLDSANPRHEPATSQRATIDALLNTDGLKTVHLAEDIAAEGLSPIDLPLVLREADGSYTVLEGNRRVAAVKLMGNPTITSIQKFATRFQVIRKKATVPLPQEMTVVVVSSREDAKHWQELRHTGQRDGRGVVPWDTEASTRFYSRRGSHADRAIAVLDTFETVYPKDKKLQDDLKVVRKSRLTTFGRLISDPYVRDRLGLKLGATVIAHYGSDQLRPAAGRILEDLSSGKVTVSSLKSKEQRRAYVNSLGPALPREDTREADPRPLVGAGMPRPTSAKKTAPKPTPPDSTAVTVKPLFDGVRLTNLGGRIAAVLNELQQLDVDKYPNASATLLRVVIELSVTQVHTQKGWPTAKLREMVKKCLGQLDPTNRDSKYQPVRAGLLDNTSVFAVATIHGYLHNPHFHPTPSELRSTAANYAAFLRGLDTLV